MKIALFSDTHLGGLGDPYYHLIRSVKDQSPDLILNAGDFSSAFNQRVISRMTEDCQEIAETISVYGNHDWYQHPSGRPEDHQVQCTVVGDLVVIHGTLWTNYFGCNPYEMMDTVRYLADFKYIQGWTTERQVNLFNNHLKQIDDWLKLYRNSKCLVLTHHAPTLKSVHPRFLGKGLNGSFVNRLEEFILDRPQIKVWAHGHVHDDVDTMIGETRILCHPRGYRGETNYENYKPKVFEL